MHCSSILLMAIYLAMPRSLQAAPFQTRGISNTQILVNVLIAPRVTNATEQMKRLYAFITSSYHLEDTPISLGLDLNADCFRLQADGKLDAVYKQMAVFAKPLYLAYSYEDSQPGAQNAQLAFILEMTSNFLNDTVSYTKHQILIKGLTPPNYPNISEVKLDERTRVFLNALVQRGIVSLRRCICLYNAPENFALPFNGDSTLYFEEALRSYDGLSDILKAGDDVEDDVIEYANYDVIPVNLHKNIRDRKVLWTQQRKAYSYIT